MFREFTAAVEQKQVAQQDAEKARFLVEKAEFVKKAAVIQVPRLVFPNIGINFSHDRLRETLKPQSCLPMLLPR